VIENRYIIIPQRGQYKFGCGSARSNTRRIDRARSRTLGPVRNKDDTNMNGKYCEKKTNNNETVGTQIW